VYHNLKLGARQLQSGKLGTFSQILRADFWATGTLYRSRGQLYRPTGAFSDSQTYIFWAAAKFSDPRTSLLPHRTYFPIRAGARSFPGWQHEICGRSVPSFPAWRQLARVATIHKFPPQWLWVTQIELWSC